MGPKKEPKNAPPPEEPKVQEPPPIPAHELEGYGRFEYPNGIVFEGHWRLVDRVKVKHGQGELKVPGIGPQRLGEQRYNGAWKNDAMDGYGTYNYASGATYNGEWKSNKHHGRGTYEFPDGALYEGQWRNHLMDGDGFFIDSNGKKWEGEFAKGAFQSKLQGELRMIKEAKQRQAKVLTEASGWFQRFAEVYAKSDKKTFKENLLPLFAVQEEAKIHVKEPFPKFDDRPPEKWNEAVALLRTFTEATVLKASSEAKQLDPERILSKQFQGLGQVVQFRYTKEQRTIRASLCRITEELWVLMFFHDSAEPEKKK